jgi:HD-like signal output (HDOD) protein
MTETAQQGFSLVSGLARELTKGEPHLPSLPESVVRIRNALSKPEFTIDELARLITPEPALVGSILTMANSVAFKRSGFETTDLKIAISRIGAGMVQTAATTFALKQLRDSKSFKDVEHLLAPEWSRTSRTAATAYLVGLKSRRVKPDEALVVGLIHNIGRIYLLSRAPTYPELFESPEAIAQLLDSFHAGVGKAIVEFWRLPAEIALAVELQGEIDTDPERPSMVAVLTAAIALAPLDHEPSGEETGALAARADFQRIKLGEVDILRIVAEREEVRQGLGLGLG